MALTPHVLLGTSDTPVLTVPALKQYCILALSFSNNSASPITISFNIRKGGATAAKNNTYLPELEIPAKKLLESGLTKFVLSAGDVISATASTGDEVAAFCSYLEVV
jgi:hypothetical protein